MGTVLNFNCRDRERPAGDARAHGEQDCEIVIFPGVRIERDGGRDNPGARPSSGRGKLDGTGGRRRPRKTS
jgi:hypothetical protein